MGTGKGNQVTMKKIIEKIQWGNKNDEYLRNVNLGDGSNKFNLRNHFST